MAQFGTVPLSYASAFDDDLDDLVEALCNDILLFADCYAIIGLVVRLAVSYRTS